MPTENRSKNTEMVSDMLPCPFCGEKPQITKHHREYIFSFMHRCPVLGPISWGFREDPQAHVEKWNARAQPAEQHQGEPVAMQVRDYLATVAARQNLELATDRDIYKAEVERLLPEIDTLRTQLAERDALLRDLEGKTILSWPDKHRISAALSASAEPRAPKCGNCDASTGQACNDKGCGYLEAGNGEPSAPVERDERSELEAYCTKVGLPLDRLPSGEYLIPATRFVSQGWHAHACAALEQKP